MRTAIGNEEDPDWKNAECIMCGGRSFRYGIWHKNAFRALPDDVDVHDPYFEAHEAKQCTKCGAVGTSPDPIGPLSTP